MAYGRPANVRSHRRGGRRRPRVAPWTSVTLVSLLVLVGLGVGYQQLLARACSGEATARIVASPSTAQLLDRLATRWAATEPSIEDGTCARVVVESRDSAEVAALLSSGWDQGSGDQPDVWVPASTAWAQKAAASDIAEPFLPDLRPSIARSPTVIAMPEPMAAALDWPATRLEPDTEVRWESLLEELFAVNDGWAQFGHPEWGQFRLGMTDPARSTAGLLALTVILDVDADGETSPEELENAFRLQQLMEPEVYHETTEQLLTALDEAAEAGEEAGLRHVSAFPALEQEVFTYNRGNPQVRLAAVYPADSSVEADHPYLVLEADWVSQQAPQVAGEFLAFVQAPGSQAELRAAGFRGTDREAGDDFVPQYGLVPELVALPRAVLVPESVTRAIDQWTALTRPTNVLLLFDVSEPMLREVPGTGQTRLERAKQAAADTVLLFPDEASVGFWEFSTALDGDLDYRSLVPMGQLDDMMEDDRFRRDHLLGAISGLTARDDTGLYNTIAAAYDTVLANYDEDAANMVVVVTTGEDDTGGRPGLSLDEMLEHLREAPASGQQVRVVTVVLGEEPDFEVMEEISELTGGRAYYSQEGFDLVDLLHTAVFGGVS